MKFETKKLETLIKSKESAFHGVGEIWEGMDQMDKGERGSHQRRGKGGGLTGMEGAAPTIVHAEKKRLKQGEKKGARDMAPIGEKTRKYCQQAPVGPSKTRRKMKNQRGQPTIPLPTGRIGLQVA